MINTSSPRKKLNELITITFKMNAQAIKEIQEIAQGAKEKRVNTVDIRSSAGQGQEQRNVQVVQEIQEIAQGAKEKRVNTVDIRSSAGQGQEQRNVQVVHQPHPSAKPNTSGGVLTGAAAAVATTLQSAKEAISKNE